MTRREFTEASAVLLLSAGASPAGSAGGTTAGSGPRQTGLCLNEDDSHYFSTRAGQKLDAEAVRGWVDQYAGTQVRELMLCPNAMRTSFASDVWTPYWHGYDPDGPDDQPLFASLPPSERKATRAWIHTEWQLHRDGIDVYKLWIERAREKGLSPWLSMRMNDVHNADDERSFIHGELWRQNPQYRRVNYRFTSWNDRALDYGRPEVRAYAMSLIRELAARYDFDGLELDWMRFGFHFRPGHEAEGAVILTSFLADIRRLLDQWQRKRRHRIRLGARVPSRPQTALGLGMDAATWARRGLIDMLVITPFWATAETDMPIEIWRQLLSGTKTKLAAGLELLLKPYPGMAGYPTNSLETVRGAAAAFLDRGVDRVYLFNYMDSQTAMEDLRNYPVMLRECGELSTLAGKRRRHVVTYADTWAPGEPSAALLPASCTAHGWAAFRIPTGPKPEAGAVIVRLGVLGSSAELVRGWQVRMNGELCAFSGSPPAEAPWPACPMFEFRVPPQAMHRGYNLIEMSPGEDSRIEWVEVVVAP